MAVRFDAATDRVSHTTDPPPDPAGGFTITAWAYLSVDRDDFSVMVRLFTASTTASLATHGSGTTLGYLTGGGSLISGHALSVGSWSRVAITCTGTSGIVYGAAGAGGATDVVSGAVAGAADPTGIALGGRSPADGAEWFNGRLAYVRVWSSVLTQTQIEAEWASTTPLVTGGLWAHWPLVAHTDLTDHSGSGRNLTAGSTATTTEADPPIQGGTVAVSLGGLTATVAGTVTSGGTTVVGAVAAALGGLTATVAGTRATTGTVATTLGGLVATVSGGRRTAGVVVTSLGGLLATVAGVITHPGVVAAPLGALTATVTGLVSHSGAVTASLGGLSTTAAGTVKRSGTVAVSLGGLMATVTVILPTTRGRMTPAYRRAATMTGSER